MAVDGGWLEALPDLDDGGEGGLTLTGLLVRGPIGRVRLLVAGVCLDFAVEDITCVDQLEVSSSCDKMPGALSVEVVVRPGAAVLAVQEARALGIAAAAGQAPFAYASRPDGPIIPPATRYSEVEAHYLHRWDLADEP